MWLNLGITAFAAQLRAPEGIVLAGPMVCIGLAVFAPVRLAEVALPACAGMLFIISGFSIAAYLFSPAFI